MSYEWSHVVQGILESSDSLDNLESAIRKYNWIEPNYKKMRDVLETSDEFVFGSGLFTVKKFN